MSKADNGISVQNLARHFGDVKAVDGIDIEIAPGEIYGFLGPNGAGKSTTVLMLVTLLPPSSGRATVAGFDIATQGAGVRSVIGAALQAVALDAGLTGRQHLHMIAQLHGMTKKDSVSRANELLERVGLTEAADRKVGGYSGGMQRRLDLALALVHDPRVLFLDEPTTGLDPQSRTALWHEVERLSRDEGVTVFLTTQYLEEADALANRIGIIDNGLIVAEGTPASLKAQIGAPTLNVTSAVGCDVQLLESTLGKFGDTRKSDDGRSVGVRFPRGTESVDMIAVVRALDEAGIQVEQLTQHEPTLDDVFLEKTGRTLEGASE